MRLTNIPWNGILSIGVAFLVTRILVFGTIYFSMVDLISALRTGEVFWRVSPQNILVDGLVRWDSHYYLEVALRGYTFYSTDFFPVYPLLMKGLSLLIGHLTFCGLLISNLAFLVALVYLYALARQEFDDEVAQRTVFYLAAAPAAFFFSALYSDSVLLACIIASFYYARNGRWVFAGIAGAIASATRIFGLLVAVFILLEALWRCGIRFLPKPWSWKAQVDLLRVDVKLAPKAWPGMVAAAGSTTGLLAYMIYLNNTFNDPLAFFHVQSQFGRQVDSSSLFRLISNTAQSLANQGNFWMGQIDSRLIFDLLTTLILIPLVVIVLIKMRPSFGLYTFLVFMVPLMTSTLTSIRRYALILVPCFILLGVWGRRPWLDRIIICISIALQVYFAILFSHWLFVG